MLGHRRYDCRYRYKISPAERLALTLRFLATGNSQVRFLKEPKKVNLTLLVVSYA